MIGENSYFCLYMYTYVSYVLTDYEGKTMYTIVVIL